MKKKKEALILCLAGAGLLSIVGVAYALTKPKAPKPPPPPPPTPPELPPPPAIPAMIIVETAPTSVVQDIVWKRTANGHRYTVCLRASAIWGYRNGQIVYGYRAYDAYFRVVDAAGKGVPEVPVLVWSTPTRDDQGGIFYINGRERTSENPLRVITNNEGRIKLWFEYRETEKTLEILDEKHDFKCCDPVFYEVYFDLKPEDCCPPFGFLATVPCWKRSPTADTEPRSYIVHVEIEGAPARARDIVVTCKFHSKVLW